MIVHSRSEWTAVNPQGSPVDLNDEVDGLPNFRQDEVKGVAIHYGGTTFDLAAVDPRNHFEAIRRNDMVVKRYSDIMYNLGCAPREEGEAPIPIIQVSVKFTVRPPRIVMITSNSRTTLDEQSCEVLDWADIRSADLIARGYEWTVNGKTGIKAYLQSLYVQIEEDALERKYANYLHEESE